MDIPVRFSSEKAEVGDRRVFRDLCVRFECICGVSEQTKKRGHGDPHWRQWRFLWGSKQIDWSRSSPKQPRFISTLRWNNDTCSYKTVRNAVPKETQYSAAIDSTRLRIHILSMRSIFSEIGKSIQIGSVFAGKRTLPDYFGESNILPSMSFFTFSAMQDIKNIISLRSRNWRLTVGHLFKS